MALVGSQASALPSSLTGRRGASGKGGGQGAGGRHQIREAERQMLTNSFLFRECDQRWGWVTGGIGKGDNNRGRGDKLKGELRRDIVKG